MTKRIILLVTIIVAVILSGCVPSSDEQGTALAKEGKYPFTDFQLEHGLYVQNDLTPTLIVEINGSVNKALLNGDYLSVSQDFIKQKAAYKAKHSGLADQNQAPR